MNNPVSRRVLRLKAKFPTLTSRNQDQLLRIAVIGAGVYCRETYLPLLKRKFRHSIQLCALWSLTRDLAEATLAASPFAKEPGVAIKEGDQGLEDILNDPKIDGILIVVPAFAALAIARKCWWAGKHVMQEKPIGKSVERAMEYWMEYRLKRNSLWYVAENYRFENAFLKAILFKQEIGRVLKIDLTANKPTDEKNKFFSSDWRRDGEKNPGGFVYDCSIHFVAAMRLIGQDFGLGDIQLVSGRALSLVPEKLPPADTAVALMTYANGVPGSFSVTFASGQANVCLNVVGTEGTIEITRQKPEGYILRVLKCGKVIRTIHEQRFSGMEGELAQFFKSIRVSNKQGYLDSSPGALRAYPEEAILDLAVIEALFKSSEQDGHPFRVKPFDENKQMT